MTKHAECLAIMPMSFSAHDSGHLTSIPDLMEHVRWTWCIATEGTSLTDEQRALLDELAARHPEVREALDTDKWAPRWPDAPPHADQGQRRRCHHH